MYRSLLVSCLCIVTIIGAASAAEPKPEPAKDRKFRLTYAAKILDAPAGAKVRAWIPVPPSSAEQSVKSLTSELPAKGEEGTEDKFGNKMLSFEVAVPKQLGEPLNFFIYPYAEVDGKAWPPENVKLEVSYQDE